MIGRYLEFQTTDFVKNRLNKIASSSERKQVWILLDRTRTIGEIAEIAEVSPRAVQHFKAYTLSLYLEPKSLYIRKYETSM